MIKDKVLDFQQLAGVVQSLRQTGKRIVFTNGCFDLLHAGHATYLEQAKALGDILILGLNSDASVRRLKGKTRPVIMQAHRAMLLAALESVDYVCIFEEETPIELIRLVMPDVLVKGGDWVMEQIVGADLVIQNGGMVKSLVFLDGVSTSAIIKKLRNE